MIRAVVFDLWDTLVEWRPGLWSDVVAQSAAALRLDPDEFEARWQETYTLRQIGPIADAVRALGGDDAATAVVLRLRRDYTRRALVPRTGAVATVRDLRARGLRVGVISMCSEEVPELWPDTDLHDLFDSTVFSCSVGLAKPDPRIYRLACDELGVDPLEAMFVGDGANDELAGAERVGMRAVLIHRPGEPPVWPEVRDWSGLRITAIPQVLELL